MSNEVTEWLNELWIEVKGIPSDIKGLINGVRDNLKKRRIDIEKEVIKMEKEEKATKIKERGKKPIVKQERIIVIKQRNGLFANLCLLYLCIFITLVGIGVLSYLAILNEKLPVNELIYYADRAVEFFKRADDMNGANRFLWWLYQFPELPHWEGSVEWHNVSDTLVSDVS